LLLIIAVTLEAAPFLSGTAPLAAAPPCSIF
jgi:hypothetical protein